MKTIKNIVLLFVLLTLVTSTTFVFANTHSHEKLGWEEFIDPYSNMPNGAVLMSSEEAEEFRNTASKIEDVYLNNYALTRKDVEYTEHINVQPVEIGNEIITDNTNLMRNSIQSAQEIILPPFVDNSTSKYFPPIGNQGGIGSCTAWSLIYYTMTNNLCFSRDLDAKSNNSNRMSPMMVYNLVNDGRNGGTSAGSNMAAASIFGCASLNDFPETTNCATWPSAANWRKAIENKALPYFGQFKLSNSMPAIADGNLHGIKELLLNGYVVSFTTSTTVRNAINSDYEIWVEFLAAPGGHQMTIVGYDDNLYYDINGNGVEDMGERGAFKVANSWGADNHKDGFVWIMYDAFDKLSSVPANPSKNFPSERRQSGITNNEYYVLLEKLTPASLVAEVEIQTTNRKDVKLEVGYSSPYESTPVVCHIYSGIWTNECIDPWGLAFDGHNASGDAIAYSDKVTLDISNMIEQFDLHGKGTKRFYVKVSHVGDNDQTIIKSFSLINKDTGETLHSSESFPKEVTASNPALLFLDAEPSRFSLFETTIPDLVYNETFSFQTIRLQSMSRLYWNKSVYTVVKKHSGTNVTTASSYINLNNYGIGIYSPIPISVNNFHPGEYIESLVYRDSSCQELLSRKFVRPILFEF